MGLQAVLVVSFFLILPFRQPTIGLNDWTGLMLFSFLLSTAIYSITVVVNYRQRLPNNLVQIETVLSKKPTSEAERTPNFLRMGGFLWVDFEKEINVKRKETAKLIGLLSSEKSVLLVGNQASGKSIILREIGYRLAKRRYIVYCIDAGAVENEKIFSNLKDWNMSNVVILIDDIHRNPVVVSDLLERSKSLNFKCVLTSRDIKIDLFFREGQGLQLSTLFEHAVRAKVSEEIVKQLIVSYCASLKIQFVPSEKEVSALIKKCGNDLWLISYLLDSWNPDKSRLDDISKNDIYEKIYRTRLRKWELTDKSAIEVIQLVSVLYQFEIPCSHQYLVNRSLNNIALKLVSEGIIIENENYFSFHHPSVAQLYLETLQYSNYKRHFLVHLK